MIQRCDTCAIFDGDEAAAEWVSSQIKSLPAELTRQREEIARLRAVAAAVAEHFESTDAPLGIQARAALALSEESH